jgi:branched-chain amino acid transport system substrate-binding protein
VTDGKGEYVSFYGTASVSEYPLTSKTVPTREAYIQRWGSNPRGCSVAAYDIVRFILPDAIKRAGTTETEAVIKALETTNIETSMAGHFMFTSSHDVFVGAAEPNKPAEDYILWEFQWQNGVQVPVYPKEIMEEAGVTYRFPPWSGPWNQKQTP